MAMTADLRHLLGKSDWVAVARNALIESGANGVKVDFLAKDLEITRGSFYWHFENRQALLDALVEDWRESNTAPMLEAIRLAGKRGRQDDFKYVDDLWLEEKEYHHRYDAAVREWARTDEAVSKAVREIDSIRIDAFRRMFIAYGFKGKEALIRARILYYHQVGYYAMNIEETIEERRRLGPYYDKVLLY